MEKILFVNACMRGSEISRTHKLCRSYLKENTFEEVDLTKNILACLDGEAIINRDKLIDSGKTDDEIFRYAWQFAQAEKIIIGAPYWDLSFPAALKTYVEHVFVRGITFKNTPTGIEGLCRAKKLIYITTAGGYIKNANHGAEYFRSLCEFFGIPQFETFHAEGLDIETNNPNDIMKEAEKAIINSREE